MTKPFPSSSSSSSALLGGRLSSTVCLYLLISLLCSVISVDAFLPLTKRSSEMMIRVASGVGGCGVPPHHRRPSRRLVLVSKRTFFSSRGAKQDSSRSNTRTFGSILDPGLECTAVISDPSEVDGPEGVPSRAQQVRRLQKGETYDLLVVGGGATGAGCALDAAVRGLRVACIERGDFSSETSSRSTKLIWAGIKYMATASAAFLSFNLFTQPVKTLTDFYGEMKMVINCHRERRYMMEKQKHLCNWIPIAIPFTTWHVSPPPFNHPLFGFFPVLAPGVLKFYDALSSFSCPPSYVLTKSKVREVFPQMDTKDLKYCAVFYEAQHNDSRTNLAIALSAAEHGAHIANYVEMIDSIRDDGSRVVGVVALDRMTGKKMEIRAKKIVFCGGPFTDHLRNMEQGGETSQPAVRGAHGTHIVLPGQYCPQNIGLLDYNTSDGRFLFYLPWEGHTLIGTTDKKGPAETLPRPPNDEVEWLLREGAKYLRTELPRQDVLSAWRGWRPLAADPHAPPGAPVSRDHIISENPKSGVLFIAGGKWTTWREMAQEVVDRVVGKDGPKCTTLDVTLFGGGPKYSDNLASELMENGLERDVAEHLARTYGVRAWEVLASQGGRRRLVDGYPYIEAEVVYGCREYACTVEDILSRRTRLAVLNRNAALDAIPRVTELMAKELGWSPSVRSKQLRAAQSYVASYGGPEAPPS